MRRRSRDGTRGGLGFTYKAPEFATQPRHGRAWARSLVVGIRSYLPKAGRARIRPGHGRIARFAVDDPYAPLQAGLESIARQLRLSGHRADVSVDDDGLVDRAPAVRSGVAWWGKSTMALTPGLGPWFVIGSVITDAELEPDGPMSRGCGTCSACLPACPTGALSGPGRLDASKCLAAIAQTGGVIPRQWRGLLGDRLYGCDECLVACPPGERLSIASESDRGTVSLRWMLGAADRTLLHRYGHFYLPGRSPRILRRNALVAMGNDGGEDLIEPVACHVGHPDWILRAHAVWALARLMGASARPLLEIQSRREKSPEVSEEIELELAQLDSGA